MKADQIFYKDSDDIDLLSLVERSILFFKKYALVFILAAIVGIALGIMSYRKVPILYQSRLIAHPSVLTNQENIQIIDTWNSLLKKQEYSEVAKVFNCQESVVRKLKKIEGTEIQKVFSAINPNGFYIDVQVTDNSILETLQKGIVYGFENGQYVKERVAFKKARLREMIDDLRVETARLDSTGSNMEKIISGKGKSSAGVIIDGSNISRQLIDLNEKLLFFEEELNFTNGIQVLQSFSKYSKPVSANLIVFIGLGLILTFSIAYIFTLFSSVNQRLKARSLARKKTSQLAEHNPA
jgi:capsular polysaccharide biosynthesis protein